MPLSPASSRGGGSGGASLLVGTTLASNGPTLSVSGIPATATMLMVVLSAIQSTVAAVSDTLLMAFNSDTTASHYGAGNSNSTMGSVMSGFTDHVKTSMPGTSGGIGQNGGMVMFIPNYAQSTTPIGFHGVQTGRIASGGTSGDFPAAYFAGQWAGGSALNTITCTWATGPNFVAGALLNVYGF